MRDIETLISPLIASQFPEFYKTDGPDFIAFVEAYYAFLEQNHQLLTLQSVAGLNVDDTLTQGTTVGSIVSIDPSTNNVLVYIPTLATFECFVVGTSLLPVTNQNGVSTYITYGGADSRFGSLYYARNLFNLKDVDTTLDIFLTHFKEKYLKNIEFDMQSNKRLLVKHSLDLYRAKGTDRAVDLFFRLVYGVNASVYHPIDDLFRLSDGKWTIPQYLEISGSSQSRAVSLVGKQIMGATSGATAFVEKYIRRKIVGGNVHVLYVSNVRGTFLNSELLISDNKVYVDSPTLIGSLSSLQVITGGTGFALGDVVSFENASGDNGMARVSQIDSETGIVSFALIDGGYGYTVSANANFTTLDLASKSQSIISDHIYALQNVTVSNSISSAIVTVSGSGYSNTDTISIPSPYSNALLKITTSNTGGIVAASVVNSGSGFLSSNIAYSILNANGIASSGAGANLTINTKDATSYFDMLESFRQSMVTVSYTTANASLYATGSNVVFKLAGNTVASGTILNNSTTSSSNGTLVVLTANTTSVVSNTATVVLASNSAVTANIITTTDTTVTSAVVEPPTTVSMSTTVYRTLAIGDTVYQLNEQGVVAGSGVVNVLYPNQVVVINNTGVFRTYRPLLILGKTESITISNIELAVGSYNTVGSYSNAYNTFVWGQTSGTTANLISISSGALASFKVGTISDSETIYLNTDLLGGNNTSNIPYMTLPISTLAYGFPKNPMGNVSSVLYADLNYDSFTIGTIGSIADINPGANYDASPDVLVMQPYLAGFNRKDYIMQITGANGSFWSGEQINQQNTASTEYLLTLDNISGIQIGEKLYQGANVATGIVAAITTSTNTVSMSNTTGTFLTATPTKSYINLAFTANASLITVANNIISAKGIVKTSNSSVLSIKRTQFEDYFSIGSTIVGSQSQATATIFNVSEDPSVLPIGMNAIVDANVATANGSVVNLEVIDSGLGYANGQLVVFNSVDGLNHTGSAKTVISGIGTGSGYYATSKGFLSSTAKIQDGDYYQVYSYDVMSKIPLEKYSDMFKKVMHISGFAFFGSVLLESSINVVPTIAGEFNTSFANTLSFNSNNVTFSDVNVANPFTNPTKVNYYTGSNSSIQYLANNQYYYAAPLVVISNPVSSSNQIGNVNWNLTNSTGMLDVIESPDNNIAGMLIQDTGATGVHSVSQTIPLTSGVYTYSVYLKSGGYYSPVIKMSDANGNSISATASLLGLGNITATSATGTGSYLDSSCISIGNGWYRVSLAGMTNGVGNTIVSVYQNGMAPYTGGNKGVYAWGAWIDVGDQTQSTPMLTPSYRYSIGSGTSNNFCFVTNPRLLTTQFTANNIANGYISMPRTNFVNNDIVSYTTVYGTPISNMMNDTICIVTTLTDGIMLTPISNTSILPLTAGANGVGQLSISPIPLTANGTFYLSW